MNTKPDPRVRFEPESTSQDIAQPRRGSWFPTPTPARVSASIDPLHWMSRASRGFSWNRTGLMGRR